MKTYRIVLVAFTLAITANAWAAENGDAINGTKLYESRCTACHSVDESRVGPAHRGVVGRKAGSVAGFKYSQALKNSKIVWSGKTLNSWLANPEQVIAGQQMFYSVADAKDRLDLIAYLQSVSLKP
jgi:cytochrome c